MLLKFGLESYIYVTDNDKTIRIALGLNLRLKAKIVIDFTLGIDG